MQQRLSIQILAILALFSATLALDPTLAFNTTLLCTERYWLEIKFTGTVGNHVVFAGGVDTYTQYIDYTLTTESGSFGLYVVYDPSFTYFAQIKDGTTPVYQIDLEVPAPCTGLTTTGLPSSKQAVWVADVFRKDTNNAARGYFWNSNLQAAADGIFSPGSTVCDSASEFQNGGAAYLQSKGYTPVEARCLMVTGSTADAGGLIQGIRSFLSPYWGFYDEVAFARNQSLSKWVMILARRQRALNCGNKFRAIDFEDCDDGNTDSLDGCSNKCFVESGWTCSENVLQEGSTCVQAPVAPTTPVSVPVAGPTSAPTVQTPTPGTPTAAPTSAPTTAPATAPSSSPTSAPQIQTPTAAPTSAPTATPSASPTASPTSAPSSSPSAAPSIAPQGNTPTGQTPTSQTPTGQTPTSQTPTGQTPTSQTPSSQTPSSQTPTGQTPTGQTPSSSPQIETPSSSPSTAPGSETPSGSPSASPSTTPDGGFTPSVAPNFTPSSLEPTSPRPSRTPESGLVNGSEKITASFMVIVTVLSVILAF